VNAIGRTLVMGAVGAGVIGASAFGMGVAAGASNDGGPGGREFVRRSIASGAGLGAALGGLAVLGPALRSPLAASAVLLGVGIGLGALTGSGVAAAYAAGHEIAS
jgi:hypothetical protein